MTKYNSQAIGASRGWDSRIRDVAGNHRLRPAYPYDLTQPDQVAGASRGPRFVTDDFVAATHGCVWCILGLEATWCC